jgi:hypothetical protein
MRRILGIAVLVVASLAALPGQRLILGQACGDDEAMVKDYQKTLTDLVATVKKESLADFEKAYHQKSCMTKLTFCLTMVNGLIGCLDKASQDATATKDQVDAYKAKRESYAKLKAKVEQGRNALKSAENSKDAKALIERFDFSN